MAITRKEIYEKYEQLLLNPNKSVTFSDGRSCTLHEIDKIIKLGDKIINRLDWDEGTNKMFFDCTIRQV